MNTALLHGNSSNIIILVDAIIVFAGRRSSLPSAVSSTSPDTQVNHQPLLSCMKLKATVDMPKVNSLWVDLPRNGLGEANAFFTSLTTLVQACRRFKKPVAVIRTDSNIVDGRNAKSVPEFGQFVTACNVDWKLQCSCQFEDAQTKHLHLKRLVFASQFPGKLDDCTCKVTEPAFYKQASGPMLWGRFLASLAKKLCSTSSAAYLGTNSRLDPATINVVQPESGTPLCLPDSPSQPIAEMDLLNSKPEKTQSFPTDSRARRKEREKAAKEAGTPLVVVKKKQFVEDHYDDCGEDLSSLKLEETPEQSAFVAPLNLYGEDVSYQDYEDLEESRLEDNLTNFMFYGVRHPTTYSNLKLCKLDDVHTLHLVVNAKGEGVDVAEVCGGVGRTSTLSVRRKLTVGPNFDLECNVDLRKPKDQRECINYFKTNNVAVAVMAPICGPYGPMSHLNWHLHPKTMHSKWEDAQPVAYTCGCIAIVQCQRGNDFINEQPYPSSLYEEAPWPTLFSTYPRVAMVVYDRCRCGLRVRRGPHKGMYFKKTSAMVVSCPELGIHFTNLRCPGESRNHQHLSGDGHGRELSEAQVWTRSEARRVADGIADVIARNKRGYSDYVQAYPTFDPSKVAPANTSEQPLPRGRDKRAPPKADSPCPGCKGNLPTYDWLHNRKIGECSYPFHQPTIWKCNACNNHKSRWKAGHTNIVGECRWATARERRSAPRVGAHPREPRRKATGDPTQGLPGTSPDGELGRDLEDEVLRQLDEPPQDTSVSASGATSSRNPDGSNEPYGEEGPPSQHARKRARAAGQDPDQPGFDPRRLAFTPRYRKKWADTGSGEGHPPDWTGFDLGRVLRVFRNADPNSCRLSLRKLHLRWWHAQTVPMQRLLSRAGVPKEVIDMVPEIVDTCAACRTWSRPLADAQASVEIADGFNHQVECDILFIYKYSIFHMIDRATRWHHCATVDSKKAGDLINAIDSWVRIYGAPKELIVDGERGIVIATATKEYLARKGIKLHERAPQQHARVIERRGALLRDSIHRLDAQLKFEGLDVPFDERLTECCFAGNALIFINGVSPYIAIFGRIPHMLPGLELLNDDGEVSELTDRMVGRVREIACQTIMEGVAKEKLIRAIKTRTLPAGETQELKVGDEVEFFRPQGTKDVSGWHGPARVTNINEITRGIIKIKHTGPEMTCRTGDVRRMLEYITFMYNSCYYSDAVQSAWNYLSSYLDRCAPGTVLELGLKWGRNGWQKHCAPKFAKLFDACRHFAENALYREDIMLVRLAKGCTRLLPVRNCDNSHLMWWCDDTRRNHINIECTEDVPAINLRQLNPTQWQSMRLFQTAESSDTSALVTSAKDPVAAMLDTPASERLSTIPEGTEETGSDTVQDMSVSGDSFFLKHEDPELDHILQEMQKINDLVEPVELAPAEPPGNVSVTFSEELQSSTAPSHVISNYHVLAANARADLPLDYDMSLNEEYTEVYFTGDTWKLLDDVATPPVEGEVAVLRVYLSQDKKKTVIQKDDDILTREEIIKHKDEVEAAMLQELETWAKFKCFSRKLRRDSSNIIDCRWVLKWKLDQETQSVEESAQNKAKVRRIIRARLTVRGFKDSDKGLIDSYAGTSQRYSQRHLVSEAVRRRWDIATTDISKAFLQGVTYDELSRLTGEKKREVNFYLPAANVHLLKRVAGFESFDPSREVLHCDKPGTGSVDAPRCFSLKLSICTTQDCGMTSSTVDHELCTLHVNGELKVIMTKHVDDLKVAGERKYVDFVLGKIQAMFGNLKIEWNCFTNCGVRHTQD